MDEIDDLAVALYVKAYNIAPGTTFAVEEGGGMEVFRAKAKAIIEQQAKNKLVD